MAYVRKRIPERSVVVEDEMPDWRATIKRHVKGSASFKFAKNDPALEPYAISIIWDRSVHQIKREGKAYYAAYSWDYAEQPAHTLLQTVVESDLGSFLNQLMRLENDIFDRIHDDLFDLDMEGC